MLTCAFRTQVKELKKELRERERERDAFLNMTI
jgi:hypothetical protein